MRESTLVRRVSKDKGGGGIQKPVVAGRPGGPGGSEPGSPFSFQGCDVQRRTPFRVVVVRNAGIPEPG